ncbi:MAG: hypothetical protein Q4D62_06840 [Planctomycetia bacterium]|nr:hypothetical protein [Planctomycetia bacterium]
MMKFWFATLFFSLVSFLHASESYLGPADMLFLEDGTLVILQRDARQVEFFSVSQKEKLATVVLEQTPNRLVLNRNRLYVSCGDWNGEVVEVEPQERKIVRRWTGIHSPWGLAVSSQKEQLFVGRKFHGDILILDLKKTAEKMPFEDALLEKIPVVREPTAMVLTPDETELYVANRLPLAPADGPTVACVVSVLQTETWEVRHVQLPDGVNNLRDLAISPDGRYVVGVHTHGNHRTITSQLFGGWTNRNGISILDRQSPGSVCCYLLDDLQVGLPTPWNVRFSPDGKLLAVTIGGSRQVVFLGWEELTEKMHRDMNGVRSYYAFFFGVGSLSQAMSLVRMEALQGIHGLAMNDQYTVVAGYFTDNLAVFPREENPEKGEISPSSGRKYQTAPMFTSLVPEIVPLGATPVWDAVRRGEVYFHDGELAVESWHSCITCHPDARVDGMNWDLLNDGVQNHKNTKSMLYAYETPPCMVTGVRPTAEIATRAGFIHIHFKPMDEERYQDVDAYIKALRPIPGIRLNPDGTLSESARRGKRLFYGPRTGCSSCHHGEYFTDLKLHDVNSQNEDDLHDKFDTPSLIETYRTAPYLHDGRYTTLEQLLFEGYHGDPEKRLDKLSPQERNDLVEYLLSL